MKTAWLTVYDQHVGKECTWDRFLVHYGQYEPGAEGANGDCPGPELLHQRAARAKDESPAGSDGWAPVELKALPRQAWEMRYLVTLLIQKAGKYPNAYYTVNTPAIAKKGKGNKPLDHRLLAVFCTLYRIESGAWFDQL